MNFTTFLESDRLSKQELTSIAQQKLYAGECLYYGCEEHPEDDNAKMCDQHQEFCDTIADQYQEFIDTQLAEYLETLDCSYIENKKYFDFQTGETFFACSPNHLFKIFAQKLIGCDFAEDIINVIDDDYELFEVPVGVLSDVVCHHIYKMMKNCIEEI